MNTITPKFSVTPVFLTFAVILPLIVGGWLLGGDSRVIGRGIMGVLIWACCIGAYFTRKKPVGGYLFIFFFQLIVGAVVAIGMAGNKFIPDSKKNQRERPSIVAPKSPTNQWEDSPTADPELLNDGWKVEVPDDKFDFIPTESAPAELFTLRLLGGLPFYLGTIAVAVLAFLALSRRDKKHLRMLRITYVTLLIASGLGVIVDWIYFKELLAASIAIAIWTAIWCAYTLWSHRVEYVLGRGVWDFDKFSKRFNAIENKELSKIRSYALMSVIGIALLIVVAIIMGNDPRADSSMAIVFIPYLIAIWFAVRAVLLRRALNKLTPIQSGGVMDSGEKEYQHNETTRDRGFINPRQRWVLGATGCLAIGAILFPPRIINLPNGMIINGGFSFLFSEDSLALVNTGLLGLELLVVGILGVIGWLIGRYQ